jgi:vacuolar-type H+-ATPase subunit H
VSNPDPGQQADAGFEVLNQVLTAEKKAAERVEDARREAAAIVRDAQDEARRIAGRADRRIQALHKCHRDGLHRAGARMAKAFEDERSAEQSRESGGDVAAVSAQLAKKLIGLTSG